jgi:hypothetical protein
MPAPAIGFNGSPRREWQACDFRVVPGADTTRV